MHNEYQASAIAALADHEYPTAGDAYTRAAWTRLATPREGQGPFEADEKGWVGRALQSLALAGLCYRVADRPERAGHRAREGVAVATDLETALSRPVQRAALREFVADFRVIGGLEAASAAYDESEAAYEDAAGTVSDAQTVTTTPLLQAAAAPLKQVARGLANGEIAVSWETLHGPSPDDPGRFLGHRAAYKRQRFLSLLKRAVESGRLAAPRGTTEYNNASHRCPACGSTDVNWVGESTLCLRCSTPMEDR